VHVERRIEAALDGVEGRLTELADRAGLTSAGHELREALARVVPAARQRLGAVLDLARLLEPPERLDRFGMDPRFEERAAPLVELLYSTWWRTSVRNIEQVPPSGPAIVVANHAGIVPWDALVLRHALRRDHVARRDLRPLLDDRECDLPLIGGIAVRLGAVRASADAAERILRDGGLVGVFPEGSAGARKPWRDRYRIQRFGRGGLVKLALRTGAPIVPCAILGSEEASPGISRTGWLAERLGIPLLSTSPLFVLSAAAALPLPSKWSLRFGEPIEVTGRSPADAEHPSTVNAITEQVRERLQAMLDEDVAARTSIFL
jgi:1-acyl-sn-glycerol-3-phosphate acyltransferase